MKSHSVLEIDALNGKASSFITYTNTELRVNSTIQLNNDNKNLKNTLDKAII